VDDLNRPDLTDDELYELLSVLTGTSAATPEDIEEAEKMLVRVRAALDERAMASDQSKPRAIPFPMPGGQTRTG
jgi:hypothetical protein